MQFILTIIFGESILLPLIAGLIRLRRIGQTYRPFFLLILVGFVVEVISFVVVGRFHKSNTIPVNIYTLVEWGLIVWQFHVWGFLRQRKMAFYALLIFGAALWTTENLAFGQITHFSPYFRFFHYFVIVLLSVNEINFMITHYNRNFFRNPKFLICIGLIIYFIYMIVDYWALEISKFGKPSISVTITVLMAYVDALANVIYAIAFLLIPAPVKFTLK